MNGCMHAADTKSTNRPSPSFLSQNVSFKIIFRYKYILSDTTLIYMHINQIGKND